MSQEDLLPRVSDENYNEFINHSGAVILFKIASCQQCEEFEPIVAETADEYAGNIRFGKALLHVPGACKEIKRIHRFDSFPTLHFYKDGALVHSEEGKLSKESLSEKIRSHLS